MQESNVFETDLILVIVNSMHLCPVFRSKYYKKVVVIWQNALKEK